MNDSIEFFCMVKKISSDEESPSSETPCAWTTYRWLDEFGNSIAPFFTSLEAGSSFLQETSDWHLKRFSVTFVVEVILVDIKQETSFYSIDPISSTAFKALTPVEFLTELIYRKHPLGMKAQEFVHDHPDIIPIEDFFRDSNSVEEGGYKQLLADADLIFGIDELSGKQSIVYGKMPLEELVRCGRSNVLGVVNIGVDEETLDLEKLAAIVQEIKGYHDYSGGNRSRVEE